MDKQLEERIRERAYELWIRHGSLHGRADEYWYQAEREILGEGDQAADTQPAPIINPAPLGMTSATADEMLDTPPAPKTRKRRSPAPVPDSTGETSVEAPKRRRTPRTT